MFDCEDFSEGEQQKKLFRNMLNIGIPANAHNGVVAGENAKVMTEEILKGFVEEATQKYIDCAVDLIWDSISEEDIPNDYGIWDMWSDDILFNESSTEVIWENIEEMCNDEGYAINLYDWCEDNDIDLDDMIYEAAEQIVEEIA